MTLGCEWKAAEHRSRIKAIAMGLSLMDVTCLHERTSIRSSLHQSNLESSPGGPTSCEIFSALAFRGLSAHLPFQISTLLLFIEGSIGYLQAI